jgi:hypothetical protein
VVAEIEKASCLYFFSKKWVIEVLPAPDGAVMIINFLFVAGTMICVIYVIIMK